MRNIVLTRVDDRLIHGEVVMGWIPTMRINRIIIVDDALQANPFAVRALQALVPKDLKCFVYAVENAVERLMAEGKRGERILLLCKTPLTLARLMEAGVPLTECNLGCAGINAGRKPFFKNVSLSREELQALADLQSKGCDVYYQLVPEQRRYEIDTALKEALEKEE